MIKKIVIAVVGIAGWWLLFDAGWRVGLGLLLMVICAGIVLSKEGKQ